VELEFPWSLALPQASPVVGGTPREVQEVGISRVGGLVRKVLSVRVFAGVASVTESGPRRSPSSGAFAERPFSSSSESGLKSYLTTPPEATSTVFSFNRGSGGAPGGVALKSA